MAISIHCPCSRLISVSEALAGQPTRCPSCGRRHIIPNVTVRPVAPVDVPRPAAPSVPLSESACADCGAAIVVDAEYCHSCGLPAERAADIPHPVSAPQPSFPLHEVPTFVAPPAPLAPVIVEVHPPAAPSRCTRHEHAEPSRCTRREHVESSRCPRHRHAEIAAADDQPNRPFRARVAERHAQNGRPQSGLGKVSMSTVYISGLLGLFGLIFAAPLMSSGCGGEEITLTAHQQASLYQLLGGIGAVMALFSFFGMLTGFLGLFHMGRKRSSAFWGLLLSFALLAMTARGVQSVRDFRDVGQDVPHTEQIGEGSAYVFGTKMTDERGPVIKVYTIHEQIADSDEGE